MYLLLDVALLIILAIFVAVSAIKGFVKSMWRTVTIVGAFILAYLFGSVFGTWICDNIVHEQVTDYAYGVVEGLANKGPSGYDLQEMFDTMPDEFTQLIENCGADIGELSESISSAVTISDEELYAFSETVARPISVTISKAAGFLVIFIVSLLLLWLVGFFVKALVKIPVVKSFDKLLGGILGFVEGLAVLCIICVVLGIIAKRGFMDNETAGIISEFTDKSLIFKFCSIISPVNFFN